MKVTLNVLDGKTKTLIKTFSVVLNEKGITIGRVNSTINIEDSLISRRHAVLKSSATGEVMLVDQGSLNGSFVNGSRIESCILAQGDEFSIGNAKFVVQSIEKENAEAMPSLSSIPKITRSTGEWIRESKSHQRLFAHPLIQEPVTQK